MPTRIALTFLALVLAGCTVDRLPVTETPSPGPSPSVGLSPVASPTVTPEPTLLVAPPIPSEPWPDAEIPEGPLARTASARVDGVDVRITLDANPLVAGSPAWITTELTNLGRDNIEWTTDGCGVHVGVWGSLPGLEWAPGADQPGIAGEFKERAVRNSGVSDDRSVALGFVPDWIARQGLGPGDFGCADIGIGTQLRPGRRFRARELWDGLLFQNAGLPPTALADITGTFGAGWKRAGDKPDRRREAIVVHLKAWIEGIDAPLSLSVGEAVDVALTHDAFAEWVKQRIKRKDEWQTVTQLDPSTGTWQIGLAQHGTGDTRIVVVDSANGQPTAYLAARIDGAGKLTQVRPAD